MTLEREVVLERRLARAKSEITQLETIIEDRSRSLYMAEEELRESADFLTQVLAALESAVIVTDISGAITRINRAGIRLLGLENEDAATGTDFLSLLRGIERDDAIALDDVLGTHMEVSLSRAAESRRQVLCAASSLENDLHETTSYVYLATDISDRKQLEMNLRHAQKLESVGQLAAGVAHEINTPVQFVGDSLTFLDEALQDLVVLRTANAKALETAAACGCAADEIATIRSTEEEIDLEFLEEEIPQSISRAVDGVGRVAKIVRAMKEFAHPGTETMVPADLNHAIATTLTVASSEYRYLAKLETDYGDLPPIMCIVGDINQVVLNIVVNAAHAIEERLQTDSTPGLIEVSTEVDGETSVIRIRDNGPGIPDSVRERVFDPFFTTKAVGKGTGQGLSLAHSVVVDRHGGELLIDTGADRGTTFTIRLPIKGKQANVAA